MPRLDKRTVDAARPRDREYVLWDDLLPRFGLRVYPSGRKGYCIQYRRGGRTRRMSIGLHGVVTPTQAREEAASHLNEVRLGRDPAMDRAKERTAPTLEEFSKIFLAEHAEPNMKPRSLADVRKILRLHLLPALGRHKLREISRTDVHQLHTSLKDRPFMANRTLGLLKSMLKCAERWGYWEGPDPCVAAKRFREPSRERLLSPAEYEKLGRTLRETEEAQPESRYAVGAIQLLMLTGCRKGEILTAKWDYIDWERRELMLPDSKTGPRHVALNAPALQVLEQLREWSRGSPWIIQGGSPAVHLPDLARPWGEIRRAAGLEDVRIHDLRHAFASAGAQAGLSLPLIGALLGQTQVSTTERYSHFDGDAKHSAGEVVGERIAAALEGKPPAEVVDLRRE
jgi:integrase